MKIFITGASGFIGSSVATKLLSEGHEISLLIRNPSTLWRVNSCQGICKIIQGDLQHPESYRVELEKFSPEVVIHLAWQGVSGLERNSSAQYGNVEGTIKLIDIAIAIGVKAFVSLGSQAEYGNINMRADENAPTIPTHLYGAAKLATYHLGSKLSETSGMRFVWLRLFSSYGPGDNPSWFIPSLIIGALKGAKPKLTNCEQMWDFIHVGDVTAAIRAVALNPKAQGLYNLGSGKAVKLSDVVKKIGSIMQFNFELGGMPYRQDQVMHLEANIDKLKSAVGWSPIIELEQGLDETVRWWGLQKNLDGPYTFSGI
jgi:nucleoside-diphosphate-sugar epimerase